MSSTVGNAAMPLGIASVAARLWPYAAAVTPNGTIAVDRISGLHGTRVSKGTERSMGRGGPAG